MCYNISLKLEKEALYQSIQQQIANVEIQIPLWAPMYHASGFAHPSWPVLTSNLTLELFQWGLIPSWVKDLKQAGEIAVQTLNARGETIFDKPSFKSSAQKHRCLIPTTGFFESQWIDPAGKEKRPYHITTDYAQDSNGVFFLAGLSNIWTDRASGEVFKTFSIVTAEANELMARIHNSKKRMPLIITPDFYDQWLNPETPTEEIKAIITEHPFESDHLIAHTVSKLANNGRLDRNVPEVLEFCGY